MISLCNTDRRLKRLISDAIHEFQPIDDSGIAVAVIRDRKLYFAEGFGFRDRELKTKVDANTFFAIGSCTKAFMSVLACLFAQDGEISLDQPIRNYLPDFGLKDQTATAELTLEKILSHRTGLPRHDALWYLGPFSRPELYYRLRYLDPIPSAFKNEQFLYNNIMYMVSGYVLESLFGSWEAAIKTRIFSQLGMLKTTLTSSDLTTEHNYAKGYEKDLKLPVKDFVNIGPAAEINSTILEMTKWVLMFLSNGAGPGGETFINQIYLQKIYREYVRTGTDVHYGLGWFLGKIQGRRLLFHQGDADGYSAYVSFMPDDGLGVIALTSQHCTKDLVGVWPDKIAARIYDYLLNKGTTDQITLPAGLGHYRLFDEIEPKVSSVQAVQIPAEYTGMFSNPGYGDICIGKIGEQLCFSYYNNTWPMVQISGTFYIKVWAFGEYQTAPILFHTTSGKVDYLSIPFDPVLFKQTGKMVDFTKRV